LSADGFVYLAATRANAVWRLLADAPDQSMVGIWVQLSGGLGPDGLAVNADGFVAVAHGQAGRAWFLIHGDPARVRTPEGSWTTAVAWHPGGAPRVVEAQTGSIYIADPRCGRGEEERHDTEAHATR
jgi:gluconolactonase